MAAPLYKLNDLARRWVKKMVWVTTGYWKPDTITGGGDGVPNDPIGEGTVTEYGWIGFNPSHFGPILPGMTLRVHNIGSSAKPIFVMYYDY